ncbi:cell division protein FtsL [Marinobacterium rhizophilum]|uniref:Cell division protein FtsL n=2 Tax=Marinobacterium rhizophilum TaxID=420402 RepID=A0ABY5HQW3_9GAMM|nr:cell division protein FtsL [Marinobacterium rhizophilum]
MDWRQFRPLKRLRALYPGGGASAKATSADAPPLRLFSAAELARPAAVLIVLALLLVGSAMAVIFSAYQYRILFNQHQNLVANWDELQVEWGQLVLEESAWAANNRIEQIASKRLAMLVPGPGMIEIVRHEP